MQSQLQEKKDADLNPELDKLFKELNDAQRVLENTYLASQSKERKLSNCRITPTDLERCELSSIKKTIV